MFSPIRRDRSRAADVPAEAVRTSVQRVIETLECRTLLAASVEGSTLLIEGTDNDDSILVNRDGTQIVVNVNGDEQTFDDAGINRVRINGLPGNDVIDISSDGGRVAQRVVISGGGGNDDINAGKGNDTIKGSSGDDVIYGNGGNDFIRGNAGHDIIYGGAGEDTLRGEAGNDILGGDREDRLNFLPADRATPTQTIPINKGFDDRLDGGDGDDWLLGGWESNYDPNSTEGGVDPRPWNPGDNGSDQMTGGAGNDVIDARGGDDTITDEEEGDLVPVDRYVNFVPNPETFTDDDYAFHNHAEMQILVDGQNIEMPIGLGEFFDVDQDLYPLLHKHWDPDNDQTHFIHMHSVDPAPITGRDIFQAWGLSFSDRHIGEFRIRNNETITVDVNGSNMTIAEFADHQIQDGDDIEIRFNTNPVV